jgi:hypothetical protein
MEFDFWESVFAIHVLIIRSLKSGIMQTNPSDVERLLFIMASLPEFLRLSLARRKLRELISMNESDRMLTILQVIRCLNSLDPHMIGRLVTSWIKEMCALDSKILTELMVTYCNIFLNEKNFINTYSGTFLDGYNSLPKEDQGRILTGVKEALLISPNQLDLVNKLPEAIKTIMGIRN